jgi:hypothetical protein
MNGGCDACEAGLMLLVCHRGREGGGERGQGGDERVGVAAEEKNER